jgi:putative transposase
MPRTARKVHPHFPHHIVQRGNRRQITFFKDNDYRYYLDLLKTWSKEAHLEIWAYCLMPNHVHIIGTPHKEDSLRLCMSQVHRRYTMMINKREGWSGHLWQSRFGSYTMDESYCLAATRYIEMNPVTAKMVDRPENWQWSSAGFRLNLRPTSLLSSEPLKSLVPDWQDFLYKKPNIDIEKQLLKSEISGKPLGSDAFLSRLN